MTTKKPRFLVDVCIGKGVEDWLVEKGYDIQTVREIDSRMSDMDVLKLAVTEKRTVMTMDKDFGELVYHSGMSHAGILLLRIEDAASKEKERILERILATYENKLIYNFCVFQDGRLRIRK